MEIKILDFIQQFRSPLLDRIMILCSQIANAGLIWIAVALILLLLYETRKIGLTVFVSLGIEALITNCILKPLIGRIRPCDVNELIKLLIAHPIDASFPSGHTAAAFSVVFAFFFSGYKKAGFISLFFAILISFSRLYLYVHYPTDVIAGILIGLFAGFAATFLVKKIWKKLEDKSKK